MSSPSAPRILVVGCGFPQLSLLRFCRSEGLFTIGADANPRAIGASECDRFVQASTADAGGILRAVRDSGADGLTTCGSEHALRTTAHAAAELRLPFYGTPEIVQRCQVKHLMREAYHRGGAPAPAFAVARTLAEAGEFVRSHPLPVILKPSRGWGQRGVAKVTRPDELPPAFTRALEVASLGPADADVTEGLPGVIVEDFIEGREFSVNAWTHEGDTQVLNVTERIITSYPDPPGITFAEVYPSGLSQEEENRVACAAMAGVRALGIRRGPSYTQVRSGPEGAFLVETAYRLGGGLDPDVALLASGISLFRRIAGVALGRPDWEASGPAAARFGGAIGRFLIGEPGRVREIEGLDEARRMAGIVSAEVYPGMGDCIFPLTDGSKRAGHVVATGRDRAEAERRADDARRVIRIVTEPCT
jgi:biotin carboxylase